MANKGQKLNTRGMAHSRRVEFLERYFNMAPYERELQNLPVTKAQFADYYKVSIWTIAGWIKTGEERGLVVKKDDMVEVLTPEEKDRLEFVNKLKDEIEQGNSTSADKRLYAELRDWIKPKTLNLVLSADERVKQIIEARKQLKAGTNAEGQYAKDSR